MKKAKLNGIFYLLANIIATALLLTIIQPPFKSSFLAWIAYVPFILIALSERKTSHLLLASYVVSLIYWLVNIYWIGYVTTSGWIAFCAYTALLWPVLVLALRACQKKKVPLLIAVPVLIIGVEHLQGLFLGGFYWRHLSHSQYANIILIQISDIFGAAGVSFLVAMVNALVVEFILALRWKKLFSIGCFVKLLVVVCAIAGTLFYGGQRIDESTDAFEQGPIVAVVQSNLPQSVKDSVVFEVNREIFEKLLELSKAGAAAGAEIVVWPETIISSIMDKAVWPHLVDVEKALFFHRALSEHAAEGAYVLVGSSGGRIIYGQDESISLQRYNSAFMYEPTGDPLGGRQARVKYDKIHLVPFGEVVPFKQSAPWLYNFLMSFSPYDFDYNLTPGTEFTVFNVKSTAANKEYRFGVMICYESTIPQIARGFALDENRAKKVDWLVNMSNDGWFVKFDNGRVRPSTELQQHAIVSVFRAVENRLSVLRSVNTGISCLIDPLGRIQAGFRSGDLPKDPMARTGVQGYFCDRVVIDSRVTIFSRFGQWLDTGCVAAVLCILILLVFGPVIRNIRKKVADDEKPNTSS